MGVHHVTSLFMVQEHSSGRSTEHSIDLDIVPRPFNSVPLQQDTVSAILAPDGGGPGRRAVSMTSLCNSNTLLTKWTVTVWVAFDVSKLHEDPERGQTFYQPDSTATSKPSADGSPTWTLFQNNLRKCRNKSAPGSNGIPYITVK